jgi:hypothetical protein
MTWSKVEIHQPLEEADLGFTVGLRSASARRRPELPGRTNRNAHETRRVQQARRSCCPQEKDSQRSSSMARSSVSPSTAAIQPVEYPIPAPCWEQT